MPAWIEEALSELGYLVDDLTYWFETHPTGALALAAIVPVLLFTLQGIRNRQLRLRQLEEESHASLANSRLPPETLERNRREQIRYQKESREKQKKSAQRTRPSGPRFK